MLTILSTSLTIPSPLAHMIRRRETTLFQAVTHLSARFRWCLTGTPIQNHLEDIGALLAFLRVSQFENKAVFRKYIVLPFEEDIASAPKNFAFLLDCVCLRRSQDLLHLPQVTETYHYITLSEDERRHYDKTLVSMANYIKEKASKAPEKRDPFGVFQAQLQLRLLCNHGTFQKPFSRRNVLHRKVEREDFLNSLGKNAEITCSVCGIPFSAFDVVGDSSKFNHLCGHKLCQECVFHDGNDSPSQASERLGNCPLCHSTVQQKTEIEFEDESRSVSDENGYFNQEGYSSKINALLDDVKRNSKGTKRQGYHPTKAGRRR